MNMYNFDKTRFFFLKRGGDKSWYWGKIIKDTSLDLKNMSIKIEGDIQIS